MQLERASGDRIEAMAVQAARESRRLRRAHTPQAKILALRLASDGEASLVLLARVRPYGLPELAARFPKSVSQVAPGVWLVRESIVVAAGATFVVSGDPVAEVRLLSTPGHFTSIAGWKATLVMAGTLTRTLRVTSWDPATGGPDVRTDDGRAYVIAKGGRFDVSGVEFSALGFRTGESSGVAWRGWPGVPTHGNVTGSFFRANYFGAFTFEAVDMRWSGNAFADNDVYGFDPHDHSNNFVVEANVAWGNGSHGIIFSRGCSRNLVRSNWSFNNRGAGLVIDDGHVASDGDPRHVQAVPSNANTLEWNFVWRNAVGVAVEGGAGNVVRENLILDDRVGIRIKDQASMTSVVGNAIAGNQVLGIDVHSGASDTLVARNTVSGGDLGIVLSDAALGRIEANQVRGIVGRGIVLRGLVPGSVVTNNTVAGSGTSAIDATQAMGLAADAIAGNTTGGWTKPRIPTAVDRSTNFLRQHPAILLWVAILLIPLVWWAPARRRRLLAWRPTGAIGRGD